MRRIHKYMYQERLYQIKHPAARSGVLTVRSSICWFSTSLRPKGRGIEPAEIKNLNLTILWQLHPMKLYPKGWEFAFGGQLQYFAVLKKLFFKISQNLFCQKTIQINEI